MIVAIHQPNYLPYLGFFHKMMMSDVFILYDTAQYSKNEYHNRNRIKTPDGAQWLTVPVQSPGIKPIRSVLIDNSVDWKHKHLKTLEANYSNAPYFSEQTHSISRTILTPRSLLADLNQELIETISLNLEIRTRLVLASTLEVPDDLSPTGRIVHMVSEVGGDVYLSGPGGRGYLDPAGFSRIRLTYDNFRHPVYPQRFGPFVANLSAIDALFNCGSATVREMLLNPS